MQTLKRTICILAVVLLSVAVYLNSLWNGFVYDDDMQVLQNPWIKGISNIPTIFRTGVWGYAGSTSNYYRPVMHLIFMLDYKIFGLAPWGFHLTSMLMHAGVCALVFLVTEMLLLSGVKEGGSRLYVPFATAAIFAVHPIHTESVAWIAGVTDPSFTLFYMLSFYFYMASRRQGGRLNRDMSVAAFFVALFCKEPAITLPAVMLAYDYTVLKCKDRPAEYFKRYLPYLLTAGAYLIIRFSAIGSLAPERHWHLSVYEVIINMPSLFSEYMTKLILPLNLNAFYSFHPVGSALEVQSVCSFIAAAGFFFVLCALLWKRSAASLGLIIIAVPLLPVLYIPALGKNVFTERYLYLPVFGFGLLLSLGLARAAAQKPALSRIAAVFLAAILLFYSMATVARNAIWRNNYTLWSDTVSKSPDAAIPHDGMGTALLSKGMVGEAMAEFQAAIDLDGTDYKMRDNLGKAYLIAGRYDRAAEQYILVIKKHPRDDIAHNNLGVIYAKTGNMDKAVKEFQTAVNINPSYADAHQNLGHAYLKMGQMDKAREEFETELRLSPDETIPRRYLKTISDSLASPTGFEPVSPP